MADEKQGFAERIARWARMGNDEQEMADIHMSATDTQTTSYNDQTDSQAQPADHNPSTEVNDSAAVSAELEQARGERDQLRDRLARLQAEFDNARKRDAKERQDARDRGTEAAIEPFLNVMDNFALALKAQGSIEQLRAGVDLILKQMEEALRGLNVQVVDTVGTQFDPRMHEALGSVESPEYPDHQVLEEIRRGYRLRDKLLRPALVKIATNSAQKQA